MMANVGIYFVENVTKTLKTVHAWGDRVLNFLKRNQSLSYLLFVIFRLGTAGDFLAYHNGQKFSVPQ